MPQPPSPKAKTPFGFPALADLLGQKIASKVAELLDYRDEPLLQSERKREQNQQSGDITAGGFHDAIEPDVEDDAANTLPNGISFQSKSAYA